MKKEPWRAAELLEEILRRAKPTRVIQNWIDKAGNPKGPYRQMYKIDATGGILTAEYHYNRKTIMEGIDGTPQDVIEWLKTGLSEGQSVEFAGEYFILIQTINDSALASEVNELIEKGVVKSVPHRKRQS
jgi:hypothetical protein